MNSQSYIFFGYGLSDVLKKIVIFEIFVAFTTFGVFLKLGDSVYVPTDHIRSIECPFRISLLVKKVRIKPAIAWR